MTNGENKAVRWAIVALFTISLVSIVGGIWAATVVNREIEGIVAIVTGCAAGIVSLVLRDTKQGGT